MFTIAGCWTIVTAGILLLPFAGEAQDRPSDAGPGEVQERGRSPETLQPARQKVVKPSAGEVQIKEASPSNPGVKPKPDMKLKYMPDLVLTWSPPNGLYVKNDGKGASYNTSVSVTCENKWPGNNCADFPSWVYVKALAPNQYHNVLGHWYKDKGVVEVTVKVDPYGEVDESNEGNNTWVSK